MQDDVMAVRRARWNGVTVSAAPSVAMLPLSLVNVFFLGEAGSGDREWVVVDTGLQGSAQQILNAAQRRFGEHSRPSAIVLTHGHFDHVGSASELAEHWDCPVYVHELELPYVTGMASYPPPDPTVGGGLMSALSWLYPRGPVDLAGRVRKLPDDQLIPGKPEWRWIPTPGHSPGHVSLFREVDRVLIAGDAFVTQAQESALGVLTMAPKVRRPPAYYTPDWDAALESIQGLRDLEPNIAMTGHGVPMYGRSLQTELADLVERWLTDSRPRHGRYTHVPAVSDQSGVVSVPPPPLKKYRTAAIVCGVFVGLAAYSRLRHRR